MAHAPPVVVRSPFVDAWTQLLLVRLEKVPEAPFTAPETKSWPKMVEVARVEMVELPTFN